MTSTVPYLSVVIPSYNELKNVKKGVLDEVFEYLKKQDYTWEVILSDDGSTDGTIEFLEAIAKNYSYVSVLKNKHAGKAPTVKAGMLTATGQWRLFTDFDQSTPINEVAKFLKTVEGGYDIAIGSREIAGAQRGAEPFHRHIMGKGFNILVQLLAVRGIQDTQCGFKLFSANATEKLFSKLYIYGNQTVRQDAYTGAFDVELLYLAKKYGYSIKELPVVWKHASSDRVSPIKDSLRMLRDIFLIRMASLQGHYSNT